jgi:2-polyprenyl-6-methoxyphenol hydroxylase-like FAD-dependent oxidoreductase
MASVRTVLIIGGGPAGLTAATALRNAGFEAELVEVNDELRPLGSGLTMIGPTLRALSQADVEALEQCIAQGSGHPGMIFGNAEGETLQRMELPQIAGKRFPGGFGITRPVFWGLLAEMAKKAGAPIHLGTTVTSIAQQEKDVEVELSDGSRRTFDLVIGADGLHSAVRELVFPDAPRPYFNGQTVWRAMIPRPPDLADDMGMYYGPRNKAGCNPVSDTEAYVFLVENARRTPRPPREQWPELIREQLSEYGGVIGWARERMTDPEKIDCRPLQVFLMPSPWYRGRVLLIGDAAHSTTPHLAMGAGIAIEDGIVLAEELAAHDTVQEALGAFMARRFERCRIVVENSAQLGAWEQDPSVPPSEHARLSDESFAAMAAPI